MFRMYGPELAEACHCNLTNAMGGTIESTYASANYFPDKYNKHKNREKGRILGYAEHHLYNDAPYHTESTYKDRSRIIIGYSTRKYNRTDYRDAWGNHIGHTIHVLYNGCFETFDENGLSIGRGYTDVLSHFNGFSRETFERAPYQAPVVKSNVTYSQPTPSYTPAKPVITYTKPAKTYPTNPPYLHPDYWAKCLANQISRDANAYTTLSHETFQQWLEAASHSRYNTHDAINNILRYFRFRPVNDVERNKLENRKQYAKSYIENVANQSGDRYAQYLLGKLYYEGYGVAENKYQGIKLFKIAAEKNNSYAQNELGKIYEEGVYLRKDYEKALTWYRRAANKDTSPKWKHNLGREICVRSYINLGLMNYYGKGVTQSYENALAWFKEAAKYCFDGKALCAYMAIAGHGTPVNYQEALHWLSLALEDDNSMAQRYVAHLFETGKYFETHIKTANDWFCLAANQGDSEGEICHAYNLIHGRGSNKDLSVALRLLDRARTSGNAYANYHYGQLYEKGFQHENFTLNPNIDIAISYYLQAADCDVTEAVKALENLSQAGYENNIYYQRNLLNQSLYERGLKCLEYGWHEDAQGLFQQILNSQPDHVQAKNSLSQSQFLSTYERALAAYQKRNYTLAIDLTKTALKLYPTSYELIHLKQTAEQEKVTNEAINKANHHFEKSQLALRDMNLERAKQEFQKAINQYPENSHQDEWKKYKQLLDLFPIILDIAEQTIQQAISKVKKNKQTVENDNHKIELKKLLINDLSKSWMSILDEVEKQTRNKDAVISYLADSIKSMMAYEHHLLKTDEILIHLENYRTPSLKMFTKRDQFEKKYQLGNSSAMWQSVATSSKGAPTPSSSYRTAKNF